MIQPKNIDQVDLLELTSSATSDAQWVGGYFAYGGDGSDKSAIVYFAVPPGKRLGRHTDTAEETQFILSGSGDLLLDDGAKSLRAGDVVVLTEGTAHDLHNTGSEDLRVIGFFAAPGVEQHWTEEVWAPGDLRATGTPNTPAGSA
jgi:quercetin dioxygenase-like cupin family protein